MAEVSVLSDFLAMSGVAPEAAAGFCAGVQARMASRAAAAAAPEDEALRERVEALEAELQVESKQLREQREEVPRMIAQRLEQQHAAATQSIVCDAPAPASIEATAADDALMAAGLDAEKNRIGALGEQAPPRHSDTPTHPHFY